MCEAIPMELSNTFHRIFVLFQIIVVVCLIFFSILDVLKIITSQDEDNIKKKQHMLIKRIIATIGVFLLIYVIQFIFYIIDIDEANEALKCAKAILLNK